MVRCMLAESGFPLSMLGELLKAAAYLKNMAPHTALKREALFKMLHGEEVDLSHLRIIGARTLVYIKNSGKLDVAA